jgi:hypothetical protein
VRQRKSPGGDAGLIVACHLRHTSSARDRSLQSNQENTCSVTSTGRSPHTE